MQHLYRTNFLIIGLLLVSTSVSYSQCAGSFARLNYKENLPQNILNTYFSTVGISSAINRGVIYTSVVSTDGHPFLIEDRWKVGSLIYDDVYYPTILLKYDLINDLLLTKNGIGVSYIIEKEKVKVFQLHDRLFVRRPGMKDNTNLFFEMKYCGGVSFLIQRKKTLKEIKDYPKVRKIITEETHFFIEKGSTLHEIKRRGDLLSLFEDHRTEMKAYLKDNSILFYRKPENPLAGAIAYYDSITSTK